MRPSPLTPPSPLWGEGVRDRRQNNFAYRPPLSRWRMRALVPRDDFAFATMHDRRGRQLAGAAAQRARRPALGDGAAAAAAPSRSFDSQRTHAGKRFAQRAVAL